VCVQRELFSNFFLLLPVLLIARVSLGGVYVELDGTKAGAPADGTKVGEAPDGMNGEGEGVWGCCARCTGVEFAGPVGALGGGVEEGEGDGPLEDLAMYPRFGFL
jgi:hypothetical protein